VIYRLYCRFLVVIGHGLENGGLEKFDMALNPACLNTTLEQLPAKGSIENSGRTQE
jgi:hypothetical protein